MGGHQTAVRGRDRQLVILANNVSLIYNEKVTHRLWHALPNVSSFDRCVLGWDDFEPQRNEIQTDCVQHSPGLVSSEENSP